ncbi:hypothetical protein [Aquimarina pacifica]|uniref:hypothetical protein n=1 Tax=Aquimarina pacifica TaxID=1296415 RepID=UPI0004716AEC|nr:hypothetical protein [Aquimarina pacifica]
MRDSVAKVFWWGVPIIFLIVTCVKKKEEENKFLETTTVNTCDCYSTSSLFNVPITFNDKVPGDLAAFNEQSQADCFAWQEFISLNWPVDSVTSFGTPGDKSFVQWETYMPKDVLFQPDGAAPPPWGTLVSDQYAEKFKSQKLLLNKSNTKLLTFGSKFGNDTIQDLDFEQAAPFGQPNWLGAQNATNVWYEILLNKDYYDFITSKGYYNAAVQHDSINAGHPINFPKGVYNGSTGAIELKAAWMEVPDPTVKKWNRYKLSEAMVLDPHSDTLRTTTVALVGLHILHKTTNQPTWVWATFEQIDNVPGSGTPPAGYNFYNSQCKPQEVKVTPGDSIVTVSCTPNTAPPYYLKNANPVPIQITRVNAIDTIDAKPINIKMQNSIKKFYPNSVFQYYQLVDVIWSQSIQPDPKTPEEAPRKINTASMLSGASIVANTTLESYVQNTNTCYSCHVFSHIAPYPPDSVHNNIFGDFSFAIKFATYSESDLAAAKEYSKELYKQNNK